MNNIKWTKPFYGVQHFCKDKIQGTVSDYENFAECFMYSWLSHKTIIRDIIFSKEKYGDEYLEKAKQYIESNFMNHLTISL